MFDAAARQLLLNLARASIENEFSKDQQPIANKLPDELNEQLACFVTLKIDERLRGCIGNLQAHSSLAKSVMQNACSAAFRDPRFEPLQKSELNLIQISISVLSQPQPLEFSDEGDLISKLKCGIDGLIIKKDQYQATFLPAVWESLPEPEAFLNQLKHKAGLPENVCPDQALVYQAESFSE